MHLGLRFVSAFASETWNTQEALRAFHETCYLLNRKIKGGWLSVQYS